jgi:hypothetical protein
MLQFQTSSVSEGRVELHRALALPPETKSDADSIVLEFLRYAFGLAAAFDGTRWAMHFGAKSGCQFVSRSIGLAPERFVQVITIQMDDWFDRDAADLQTELLLAAKTACRPGQDLARFAVKIMGTSELLAMSPNGEAFAPLPTDAWPDDLLVSDDFFVPFGR